MKVYQIRTFSHLTGLSVRSLQYYDALGLLSPTQKNPYGHRLYSDRDLLRLQQITMLKGLGWSLRDIHRHLYEIKMDQTATLKLQEKIIKYKIRQLEKADQLNQALLAKTQAGNFLDQRQLGELIQLTQLDQYIAIHDLSD
jgi:7-cyano-7-deazaguanine reductase